MPDPAIIFFSESAQELVLNEHNQHKKKNEKIPLMPRNSETGWPLLQYSLFILALKEYPKQKYEPAIGGGKCHDFNTPLFSMASLLAKLPSKVFINITYQGEIKEPKKILKTDNYAIFINDFNIQFPSFGITIKSESTGYGRIFSLECSDWDGKKLNKALRSEFPFKNQSQRNIEYYAGWYHNPIYSESQIIAELDPEVAIFAEGQIYVDFGKILDKEVSDPQIKKFFELIFKVKEFQALQKSNEQFKPDEDKYKSEAPSEEILEIVPSLSALYQSIENLRVYGSKLPNKFISDHVDWLVQSLNTRANQMNKMISTQSVKVDDIEQFKSEFKALLHSKDHLMSEHRTLWKPLIANILLCLASLGLGLIAIAIKTGVGLARSCKEDKKLAASGVLFFAETHRQKLIRAIEQEVPLSESELTF